MENPEFLYKYKSLNSSSLDFTKALVRDNELFFTSPKYFNDPFEFKPLYYSSLVNNMKKKAYDLKNLNPNDKRLSEIIDELNKLENGETLKEQIYLQVMGQVGVFCLSEEPNNILMWSHYADAHQGICLRFKRCLFSGDFFSTAIPIEYVKTPPVIDIDKSLQGVNDNSMRKAWCTKSIHWSYEKEWRIISGFMQGKLLYFPESLDAIILGSKISNEHRMLVTHWVKDWPQERGVSVKILESSLNEKNYNIEILE